MTNRDGRFYRASSANIRASRRIRLYRRGVSVLMAIQMPGQRLVWSSGSGRYLINGQQGRSNRVIPRTLHQLIRLNCLRQVNGAHGDLFISETGRKLIKRFEFVSRLGRK